MPNLLDEYRIIFLSKRGKAEISPKKLSVYWCFLSICFEVCQKPNSNLLLHGILVQGFRMPSFVQEYKIIFPGKSRFTFKLSNNLISKLEFPVNWLLKSVKSLNEIFLAIEYYLKTLECQIWSTNAISFSWENETKLKTLKNLSPYIGVSFKFVLKTIKSLNRIFVDMEYWFKALECQIWLTNTILFLWETETNLGTLQKLSPYIRVSYKVVLKSVKTLNRILWAMEYWFSL